LLQLDTLSNPENPVLAFTWAYVQRKTRIVQPESLWVVHKWWAQGMPVARVMGVTLWEIFHLLGGGGLWGTARGRWVLLEYYSNMCYPPLAKSGTFLFPSSFPSKFFLVFCSSSQFCASSKMDAIRFFFLYKVLYDIYGVFCNQKGKLQFFSWSEDNQVWIFLDLFVYR
jgi:hypothetical protein